jgi:hypothetical protein
MVTKRHESWSLIMVSWQRDVALREEIGPNSSAEMQRALTTDSTVKLGIVSPLPALRSKSPADLLHTDRTRPL